MPRFLIRLAIAADFGPIAELVNTFIVKTATHFGWQPHTADELCAAWQEDRDRFPWLVMEIDGEFAGYAKAGTWRTRTAYQWTVETGVYLAERARGQGLGKMLYGALVDLLTAQGFHSIVAGLTLPNPVSEHLHRSLGFVPVGIVREAGLKFGAWHDVAFYQRFLDPGRGSLAAETKAVPEILHPTSAWCDRVWDAPSSV